MLLNAVKIPWYSGGDVRFLTIKIIFNQTPDLGEKALNTDASQEFQLPISK